MTTASVRIDTGDHAIAIGWCTSARVAIGLGGGTIAIHDAKDGARAVTIDAHPDGMLAMAISPDGSRIATGGMDGHARLWDAASGAKIAEIEAHAAWVEHVRFSPCGRFVAIGAGKKVRVHAKEGAKIAETPAHASTIAGFDFSSDGEKLAVARYGGIDVWRAATGELDRTLEWKTSLVSVAWQPRDRYVAAGCQDNAVHFWKLDAAGDAQMSGYPGKPKAIVWSYDGTVLATGGGEQVVVWGVRGAGPEGTKPTMLEAHTKAISVLAASHKDQRIASGGRDGRVCVWRPQRSTKPVMQAELDGPISGIELSPDDRMLAACAETGAAAIYKLP